MKRFHSEGAPAAKVAAAEHLILSLAEPDAVSEILHCVQDDITCHSDERREEESG